MLFRSLGGLGARQPGRSWRARSSPTACGASACSCRGTKPILPRSAASLRSRKRLRTWVGPMAATCGWTFGTALTSIGYGRSRRSWSPCNPDIIVAPGTLATAALQRETRTIPIVFGNAADPVASGIVARLDRPGGNITGFASNEASLGGKWLELLAEIAHGLKRAAIMFNPNTAPASTYMPTFEMAARSLKIVPRQGRLV